MRRIAHGIKRQDWFLVLIELITVIVGLFLGLQIDQWNTDRQDRADQYDYLIRIHDEIVESTKVRSFVRDIRFKNWMLLSGLVDDLYNDTERPDLTIEECSAIHQSSFLTAFISDLPSLNTLIATGRINIVDDNELQAALIIFELRRETLIRFTEADVVGLATKYPELLRQEPQSGWREAGNFESQVHCNLELLRSNQAFLNDFADNFDIYEAYMNSGLKPMVEHVKTLHELLDETLAITHE